MSISLYFGLPGCGKTTILAMLAKKESDKITMGISKYQKIYGNINLTGILHYQKIDFQWLGLYDIRNALILIDEATLEADNRDFKGFKFHTKQYFLLHRHYKVDIILFTQQWDGVDKKIRVITDKVYYVYKGKLTGKYFTRMYRVPYGIIIPDPKKTDSEKLGEIIQGYCKPNIFVRFFSPWIYRQPYYRYFDSWEAPKLDPIPSEDKKKTG